MKFILDENMDPSWRSYLRAEHLDVYDWEELGPQRASDEIIMEYARKNNYVVITQDGDYGAILHREKFSKPSVIHLRVRGATFSVIGRLLLDTIKNKMGQLERGALIIITLSNSRPPRVIDLPYP